MMVTDTLERARGRWQEILPRLGISTTFLQNKHGPCPLCGGKDRFRWDNKDDNGGYYCGQCGPGSGMTLAQKKNGWDAGETFREIDEIIGNGPIEPVVRKCDDGGRERRAAACKKTLTDANDHSVVENYLHSRGLSSIPMVLRGHPALEYWEDKRLVGKYPAMIAPIVGSDGTGQSCHRTYIGDVPSRKKIMKPVDGIAGGAIRLFPHTGILGVAEGVETAIAAHEIFEVPVWACISDTVLKGFVIPEDVTHLIVFGDNDMNFAGQKAAYDLGNRAAIAGVATEVKIPDIAGHDWLDALNNSQ